MSIKQDNIVHAKGFSLKGDAKNQLTFESISSCLENSEKIITVTYCNNITRDKTQNVFVQNEVKKFRFTFDKRRVLSNFFTHPYGYRLRN